MPKKNSVQHDTLKSTVSLKTDIFASITTHMPDMLNLNPLNNIKTYEKKTELVQKIIFVQ